MKSLPQKGRPGFARGKKRDLRKGRAVMELEHLLQQSGWHLFMQLFLGSLMVPAILNRPDLYRSFVRTAAAYVVSFGPFGLLLYVLFEVSRLA